MTNYKVSSEKVMGERDKWNQECRKLMDTEAGWWVFGGSLFIFCVCLKTSIEVNMKGSKIKL